MKLIKQGEQEGRRCAVIGLLHRSNGDVGDAAGGAGRFCLTAASGKGNFWTSRESWM